LVIHEEKKVGKYQRPHYNETLKEAGKDEDQRIAGEY
jgi:hypothetical protein